MTKLIGGLAFTELKRNYYKRGILNVYQSDPRVRWVAVLPGCSATGATADGALSRLRARIAVAAAALNGASK